MVLYARDEYLLSEYTPVPDYENEIAPQSLELPAEIPADLSVKPYPIPSFTLIIPWPSSCSSTMQKPVTITWDPVKTSVSSARLVISATPNKDPVALVAKFNGSIVKEFFWGEGTKGEQTAVVDVPIINGSNTFSARTCKHLPWVGIVNVNVSAHVEVTFEGETPQRPWWEIFQEWLSVNWPYIAIGTGLVIIGGSAYVYLARPGGK